ncbi:hypothetical protein [Xenorhabdus hominickii]|uniref:Uncharacterized protein n=1 Tax=Xenorhabdus hominickii TaxID=351679 RepID=A0A2G0Q672_XENHO|nr:hypothetical protein [Xenorhabdus hominickii]AOM39513.1 hypothetical protein A9255_02200 [Xenorhabdus hominickii]PHM54717.1 hypothetical protein Xhom_02668 [Xenorhabdus hominickii]
MNEEIKDVITPNPKYRSLIDARNSSDYTGGASDYGVFLPDEMHYNGDTQTWFAQQESGLILSGYKGVAV